MSNSTFNPHDYVIAVTVKNQEGEDVFVPYLPVKVSEMWFRHEHPKGRISTEMQGMNTESATFKACVYLDISDVVPVVEATATRYKEDGKYFVTSAETAAVGKALSRLGYGTPLDAQLNEGMTQSNVSALEEGIPVDNLTNILPTKPVQPLEQPKEEEHKEENVKKSRKSRNADCFINETTDKKEKTEPVVLEKDTNELPKTFDEAKNVVITFKSAAWTGKPMGNILDSKNQSPEYILEFILKSISKDRFPKEYAAAEILLNGLKAA